jgi:hypothetical protein
MYYPDLTPYDYGMTEYKDALNIGWLEIGHEFPIGDFPEKEELLRRLEAKKIENKYRGFHGCEFCENDKFANKFNPERITNPNFVEPPEKEWHVGNGEYIVQWNGKTYSAPVLVVHYIKSHNYKPPQEFIDAVMNEK